MLKITNLYKVYDERPIVLAIEALDLELPDKGFVSVIGASGCGKTTLLNIIGGLDGYDEGEVEVNGFSTRGLAGAALDDYRNKHVGFVFQNANLVSNLSIAKNIELPLEIAGLKKVERKARVDQIIKEIGLEAHRNKPVSHLSGGEQHRVAIARAIVNNPEIVLADEPTGALDDESSDSIMDILKEISKTRLVIAVTHKPAQAQKYSDRIITLSAGKVANDQTIVPQKGAKPAPSTASAERVVIPAETTDIREHERKRGGSGLIAGCNIALVNLITKRFRSIAITLAMTLGVIALSVIMSLSSGFSSYANTAIQNGQGRPILIQSKTANQSVPDQFRKYIEEPANAISKDLYNAITFDRVINFNLLAKNENISNPYKVSKFQSGDLGFQEASDITVLGTYYDLVHGAFPDAGNNGISDGAYEIALILDDMGGVSTKMLQPFGITLDDDTDISAIIGKEFRWVKNNEFYEKSGDLYRVKSELTDKQMQINALYENLSVNILKLRIVGVLKAKGSTKIFETGYVHSKFFSTRVLEYNRDSQITTAQSMERDRNVITGASMTFEQCNIAMSILGRDLRVNVIRIFPKANDSIDKIKSYVRAYNNGLNSANQVTLVDEIVTVTTLVAAVRQVLSILAILCIAISIILLSINAYMNERERSKDIAIMRSVGASRLGVALMVVIETLLIGATAGLLGAGLGAILTLSINSAISSGVGLVNIATLSLPNFFYLIFGAIGATMLSALFPSIDAASRKPAEVLRMQI